MNYSEMSDFEINCAVAEVLGRQFFNNGKSEDSGRRSKSFVIDDVCRDVYESGAWSSDVFDPCNSWADAGPIIERELIALSPEKTCAGHYRWFAFSNEKEGYKQVASNKSLRAAMIVFLMMNEATNA